MQLMVLKFCFSCLFNASASTKTAACNGNLWSMYCQTVELSNTGHIDFTDYSQQVTRQLNNGIPVHWCLCATTAEQASRAANCTFASSSSSWDGWAERGSALLSCDGDGDGTSKQCGAERS